MSSIPGYTLEDWLEWNYGIDRTAVKFAPLVEMFEPHREYVEQKLDDFEPDEQSWRAYNSAVFGSCFEPEFDKAVDKFLYGATT